MDLLVVDDHPELVELVTRSLTRDGHRVRSTRSAVEAASLLASETFDVVVLDVALPDGSGVDVCRRAREAEIATPILVLTAHASVEERVAGLDAGADDFLAKPFAVAELCARVRALGRRRGLPSAVTWEKNGVALDFSRRQATVAGAAVPLTAREWGIVEVLVGARGHVVPRSSILVEVWGNDEESSAASLEVLIARIRKKLGDATIRTVRGEGYAVGD